MTDSMALAAGTGRSKRPRTALYAGLAFGIVALTAAILLGMGRTPICTCGTIELWHGNANDSGNSQHLSDWYSFSHIIHGFLFYGAAWLVGRLVGKPVPLGIAFLVSLGIECAWEIAENTSAVIERYRATTISLDYYGDSVINSLSDILMMIGGFWLARVWPVWLTVAAALLMEAVVGYWIRDNLALNIIMLIHPVEAIRAWQSAH